MLSNYRFIERVFPYFLGDAGSIQATPPPLTSSVSARLLSELYSSAVVVNTFKCVIFTFIVFYCIECSDFSISVKRASTLKKTFIVIYTKLS